MVDWVGFHDAPIDQDAELLTLRPPFEQFQDTIKLCICDSDEQTSTTSVG